LAVPLIMTPPGAEEGQLLGYGAYSVCMCGELDLKQHNQTRSDEMDH